MRFVMPRSVSYCRILAAFFVVVGLAACDRLFHSGDSTPDAGTPAPPPPPADAAAPDAATTAPPVVTCVQCATQEDFDAAKQKGRGCCPTRGCALDSDWQR